MVRCAAYINNKLVNEGILQKAFNADPVSNILLIWAIFTIVMKHGHPNDMK